MPRSNIRKQDREFDDYMADVQDYLGKVERGRSTRRVLPNDPAISPQAETLRQTQKIEQGNKFFGRYDRMIQNGRRK